MKYLIVYPQDSSSYLSCTVAHLAKKLNKAGIDAEITQASPDTVKRTTAIVTVNVKKGTDRVTFEKDARHITLTTPDEALAAAFCTELYNAIKTKRLPRRYEVAPFLRKGWELGLPAYEGGVLSEGRYDCGSGIHNFRVLPCADESYMQIVSSTSLADFNCYLKKLERCGFLCEYNKSYDSNGFGECLYAAYSNGYARLYAYYSAAEKQARIIEDRASCSFDEFNCPEKALENTEATVYSYGLKLSPRCICRGEPGGDDAYVNCGQLWVIKQADNGLMIIDGGHDLQATPEAMEGLWKFLHDVTGQGYDEVIRVTCWMGTHPHGDHFVMPMLLGRMYPGLINFERALYNYPHGDVVHQVINDGIARLFEEQYPDIKVMKCHAGQCFTLGAVTVEVLTAHEDATDGATCQSTVKRGNDMNTVFKLTMPGGTKIMVLGDFTAPREPHLIASYAPEHLRCEVVQIAHHGFNSLPNIYNSIGAEYAVWTQHNFFKFDQKHVASVLVPYSQAEKAGARMQFFSDDTLIITCKPDRKVSFKKMKAIF